MKCGAGTAASSRARPCHSPASPLSRRKQLLRHDRSAGYPRLADIARSGSPGSGNDALNGKTHACPSALRRPRSPDHRDRISSAARRGRGAGAGACPGAQLSRRMGLSRHGVRQAQDASGGGRRGVGRDRGGRRGREPVQGRRSGDHVRRETCGHCKACREGRDNLCENVAGIMGFHIDGFARE